MKCLGVTWTEKQQLIKLTVTINTKCCCIDISCTKYLYTAPIFPILIIHNKMVLPKNYFSLQRWEFVLINYHFFWRIANYVQNNWPPPHRLRINESFFKKLIGCWLLLVRGWWTAANSLCVYIYCNTFSNFLVRLAPITLSVPLY